MPTILFFKNKSEVGRVVGADVGKIQSLIKTYEGGSSFSGGGQTLGGGSGNTLGGTASKATGSGTAGAKKGNLDNAPYHVRLLTAVGHLSSGILSLCTSLLRSFVNVASAAKTGLLGDGSQTGNEGKTVESPGGSCQIQIRMLDGSSIRGDFEPEHTLKTVHEFVKATMDARGAKAPGFSLMTNFPKTYVNGRVMKVYPLFLISDAIFSFSFLRVAFTRTRHCSRHWMKQS